VKKSNKSEIFKSAIYILGSLGLLLIAGDVLAASTSGSQLDVGTMSESIYNTFTKLTQLITGGSYLAGLGFSVAAIMKFKQHKDNPTQIPIGTPIALVFIAAALLFLPTILGIAGNTMFGTEGGQTAGPTGSIIKGNK